MGVLKYLFCTSAKIQKHHWLYISKDIFLIILLLCCVFSKWYHYLHGQFLPTFLLRILDRGIALMYQGFLFCAPRTFLRKLGHTFSKNSMATQDIIAVTHFWQWLVCVGQGLIQPRSRLKKKKTHKKSFVLFCFDRKKIYWKSLCISFRAGKSLEATKSSWTTSYGTHALTVLAIRLNGFLYHVEVQIPEILRPHYGNFLSVWKWTGNIIQMLRMSVI